MTSGYPQISWRGREEQDHAKKAPAVETALMLIILAQLFVLLPLSTTRAFDIGPILIVSRQVDNGLALLSRQYQGVRLVRPGALAGA